MVTAAASYLRPFDLSAAAEALFSLAAPAPQAPQRLEAAEPDESALIARCRADDRAALGELYRLYRSDALRFIRHAARGSQDAEDILQEVFLEVAHSIRSFGGRSSFQTWLRSICVRTAMRHMRKRVRQVGEDEGDLEKKAEKLHSSEPDPGEGFERRERARRVAAILEQLAPKKRMVLLLHDFEGMAPKEISTLVGAPVLTVRTRLFYARKELAALAAQDPMLHKDLEPWFAAREGER